MTSAPERIPDGSAPRIELVLGDITEQDVDAIVNAANNSLLGGGGVDGAIHRRGGYEILAACRALRAGRYPDGLPTGDAVATTGGKLRARHVIHTVGPVYSTREDRSPLLESAFSRSLAVARELGATSVAFPAISAGVYGYPIDQVADIGLSVAQNEGEGLELIRFVLFSEAALAVFERAGARASG